MQREIQLTADGSHTVFIPELNITYHSSHGAVGESRHLFINAGLLPLLNKSSQQPVRILEIGFGTGLNALLSLQEAIKQQRQIRYIALEIFPLLRDEVGLINHGQLLNMEESFLQLHAAEWEKEIYINEFFTLEKKQLSVLQPILLNPVNCIFFDAFAPSIQPEVWTQDVFEKMFALILPGGTLLTYSSKSEVRRAMQAAGFSVTKVPGPWGKREMVKAMRL